MFNQGNFKSVQWIKSLVDKTLKDQFVQEWRADIAAHSSCDLYDLVKVKFEQEKYLVNLPFSNMQALLRLRTNNNRLAIVIGRYRNNNNEVIPRHQHYCKKV